MRKKLLLRIAGYFALAVIGFYLCAPLLALLSNAVFGPIQMGTHKNDALPVASSGTCSKTFSAAARNCHPVPRARETISPEDAYPDVFVGLALSGGGSRAANFSLAAMEQLQRLGLLKHVNAISSVSGGGFAGAMYALEGEQIDWTKTRQKLLTDFRGIWQWRLFHPVEYLRWLFTDADRTSVMAGILEKELFGDKTFAALGKFEPGRPRWLANATSVSDGGGRFVFSEERLAAHGSRLDNFPIVAAVMASGTFPGAFNSTTLKHYPPAAIKQPATSYEHLIDGGPADNLGIETLVAMARAHQKQKGAAWKGCLIFVVDAHAVGVVGVSRPKSDPRSWYDYAVDFNFLDAIDVQFDRRRREAMRSLGLEVEGFADIRHALPPLGDVPHSGANRLGSFPVEEEPKVKLKPKPRAGAAEAQAAPAEGRACRVWHIALSGLMNLKPWVRPDGDSGYRLLSRGEISNHPVLEHRARLHLLVSQISTDYRLEGPDGCPADLLQTAIYETARTLVQEDIAVRQEVCGWFQERGLEPKEGARCATLEAPQPRMSLKLAPDAPLHRQRARYPRVKCAE